VTCSPQHASSGKTIRNRSNRGGNRQADRALWRVVIARMGTDEGTRVCAAGGPS
jgi:transposase